METSQMIDTLRALSPEDQRIWLTNAALVLAVMLVALWVESRFFTRSRRVGSWFVVRLVSLVMAPVTLAALFLPPLAVAGMEGLAVFYGLLFTAAPLLWFGSHLLVARWVKPQLSKGEGLVLAFSGLAILAIPALAVAMAYGPLHAAARDIGQRTTVPTSNPPLAHTPRLPLRVAMPGAGWVYTQSLIAPPDVRLERVEQRRGGTWPTDASLAHPAFCTHGNDVHLMWSAKEPQPYLRLHWLAANGQRLHSEFTPDPSALAAAATQDFSITFRDDGFDPVVPIPRSRVDLAIKRVDGSDHTVILGGPQPGDTPGPGLRNDCLMQGYARPNWQKEGQVQTVAVMFYFQGGVPPLRALISRPPTP